MGKDEIEVPRQSAGDHLPIIELQPPWMLSYWEETLHEMSYGLGLGLQLFSCSATLEVGVKLDMFPDTADQNWEKITAILKQVHIQHQFSPRRSGPRALIFIQNEAKIQFQTFWHHLHEDISNGCWDIGL